MSENQIIPVPRIPISVRPATMEDLSFIDGLQKKHTKQVGWMPTMQLQGKIERGHVLVAEEGSGFRVQGSGNTSAPSLPDSIPPSSLNSEPRTLNPVPVGYCIGNDQYFKRDDVGIIYQVNVVPGMQRGLVGAMLVKAMFERSAYGCRLFCCWCAQDIEANRFWESLGFIPLAFRSGSRAKERVHIFWQRRIREGDVTTPYWFPAQTSSGSIREDRLVLPIPPGTHWSDAKPIVLPGEQLPVVSGQLPAEKKPRTRSSLATGNSKLATSSSSILRGALNFGGEREREAEKKKREPSQKMKNDPKLVAAARELRDRWLEQVNSDPAAPELISRGKYQVSRMVEDRATSIVRARQLPLIDAA